MFLETRPTYDTLAAFPSAWELHGPTVAWFGMDRLAQRLAQAKGVKLDVFHWGDSQIEGDRITGTIRASWQRTWGGRGPGWILPQSPSNSFALKAQRQGSIARKLGYGNQRDTSHRFLPFLGFNEFDKDAVWKVRGNPIGHRTNHGWTQTRMWCAGAGTWVGSRDSAEWVGYAARRTPCWFGSTHPSSIPTLSFSQTTARLPAWNSRPHRGVPAQPADAGWLGHLV